MKRETCPICGTKHLTKVLGEPQLTCNSCLHFSEEEQSKIFLQRVRRQKQ